jgi:hypothetical protein
MVDRIVVQRSQNCKMDRAPTVVLFYLSANDSHNTQNIIFDSHNTLNNFNDPYNTLNIYFKHVALVTVGSPETLSTVTCSREMLGAFIVSEVVYSRSKGSSVQEVNS